MNLNQEQVEQIREFVSLATSTRDALLKEAEALRGQLSEKTAELEKQASLASGQPTATLQVDSVTATADNMVKAGYLKESEKDEMVKQASADPAVLLACLDKLAEMEIQRNLPLKSLGKIATDEPAKIQGKDLEKQARKSDQRWDEGVERLQSLLR